MPEKETVAKRDQSNDLALLYDVSQLLNNKNDFLEVAPSVLALLRERSGLRHMVLVLHNRQSGDLTLSAAVGLTQAERERAFYVSGEGVVGKVIASGAPMTVPRVSKEPLYLDRTGAHRRSGDADASFICVPILADQEVVGALAADLVYDPAADLEREARMLSVTAALFAQAMRLRQAVEQERRQLLAENERLQDELRERFRPDNIIGNSQPMQAVYDLIAQVANSGATVLIRGESGTGKELAAHAIHHNSNRSGKPYIKVNCAALPETILEAELFGHEKGAFTGALAQKKGRFELAEGGTIFLDEVGDFSPTTQVKLLRVLQEREFERVGGVKTIRADVRILAATNRDLEELVAQGKFREDLYYRLNVFPIHLPGLRQRKSDILLLADFFVQKYARASGKDVRRISTPAIDMMMAYHWPGNVRELENCIERATLLTTDHVIHGHHLPPTLQTAEESDTKLTATLAEAVDNLEREMIVEAMKSARGNATLAAKTLGITERIIGLRLKKYDIDYKRFRGA
jgi:Nif-specific regulatory protein